MGQTAAALHDMILSVEANICQVSPPQQSFDAAFEWAISQSAAGDVILLSPGCASYDWFRNFADRGAQFIDRVRAYEARVRETTSIGPF
jgi:UDP-N-acetylmuramoylalanine--D-glutamate ligase